MIAYVTLFRVAAYYNTTKESQDRVLNVFADSTPKERLNCNLKEVLRKSF